MFARFIDVTAAPGLLAAAVVLAACSDAGPTDPVGSPPVLSDPGLVDPPVAARVEEALERIHARPREAGARLALGKLYDANGIFDLAERAYAQAVALDGGNARALYHLARMRAETGRAEQAVADLERVAGMEGGHAPVHWRRGRLLLDLGRVEEAEGAFEAARRAAPADCSGPIGLALAALQRGDPQTAIRHLEGLLLSRGEDGYAHRLLARAWRTLGEAERAREEAARDDGSRCAWWDPWEQEIRQHTAGYGESMGRAEGFLQAGKPGEAWRLLEPLLGAHPGDIAVLGLVTRALLELRRPDEALGNLERAQRLGFDHFKIELNIGLVHLWRGRPRRALSHLERTVAMNPDWGPAHRELAGVRLALGDFQGAIDSFQAALERGLSSQRLLIDLGIAQWSLGRWRESAATFERAIREYPEGATHHVCLAAAQVELGLLDEASASLDVAEGRQPGHPKIPEIRRRVAELRGER